MDNQKRLTALLQHRAGETLTQTVKHMTETRLGDHEEIAFLPGDTIHDLSDLGTRIGRAVNPTIPAPVQGCSGIAQQTAGVKRRSRRGLEVDMFR